MEYLLQAFIFLRCDVHAVHCILLKLGEHSKTQIAIVFTCMPTRILDGAEKPRDAVCYYASAPVGKGVVSIAFVRPSVRSSVRLSVRSFRT